MMLEVYLVVAAFICLFFLLLSLKNSATLKQYSSSPHRASGPKVSIIIPARNEASNIGRCLDSLLCQNYKNYEVLVIDDNSTDATWQIMKVYRSKSDKIRIYMGLPLEEGWNGKQYACQQLAEKADGDILVFTDADTVHFPASIRWLVDTMEHHQAGFMSGYLYHEIGSIGEAVVVPSMYIMTALLMPLWLIPEKNNPALSFGIGQLLVCRRQSFDAVGGFGQCRDSVVEDMSLARLMKAQGYKCVFLDAKEYIRCRMYTSFGSAFRGFSKNLYGALHQNPAFFCGLFFVIAGIVEFPFLHFLDVLLNGNGNILLAGLPVILFFSTWHLTITDRKLNPLISLLYPVLFVNIMAIALISFMKTGLGKGVEWKGRLVGCHTKTSGGEKKP